MANMYITELKQIITDTEGRAAPVGLFNGTETYQAVTYTSSAASAAFVATTSVVRVTCDEAAFLVFGSSPTATATGTKVQAGSVEYFGVTPGQKVAAYDGTT